MSVITFGVIGTNWITDSYIQAAHKTEKWKLHAVYSRSKEQATNFASKYECTNTYDSLDDLAADDSMQAVYIASPNSLHYIQAKQFLKAKKHVILEKPATSTVAELDDLFRIAKEQGVYLIEAFRHIQEANFKLLKKSIMQEQKLGKLYGASLTYASYSSRYNNVLAGETPNIFSLDFSGGSLVDIGVYPVTFAVALFGRPKSQTYVPTICRTGVDLGGMGILSYDGFGVQINNAKGYNSAAPCEIYGEKGTVTVNATTDISTVRSTTLRGLSVTTLSIPYHASMNQGKRIIQRANCHFFRSASLIQGPKSQRSSLDHAYKSRSRTSTWRKKHSNSQESFRKKTQRFSRSLKRYRGT